MKVVLQELSHLFISVSLQHRCFVSFRATVKDRSLTAAAAAAWDATKEYLILAKLTSSWSAGEHMLRPMGSIFFRAATMSDVCTEYRSPRFFFLVRSASEPPPWEETPHTREHSQNLLKCPQRHTEISASCDNNVFFHTVLLLSDRSSRFKGGKTATQRQFICFSSVCKHVSYQ